MADSAGILTFHCSDNFGAMLQAYGLKEFLRSQGVRAELVNYAPFFMTGRHWWVPYRPSRNFKEFLWRLTIMPYDLRRNLRNREAFAARRKSMGRFRREHLLEPGQRAIRFLPGLGRLPYAVYVVGSDQIWNPDITGGLRRAYFGDFRNPRKKRVVAYAASLGRAELAPAYDGKFSRLIQCVDAVSLREGEAAPYVQRLYGGPVVTAPDPVFLLGAEQWRRVERAPGGGEYILTYATERNPEMSAYLGDLARKTGLPVLELDAARVTDGTWLDAAAGPAEFLGYVHHAAYAVTNSFHAAAFSILFEKRFRVFPHRTVNARLAGVLRLHGLEDRLGPGDIDAPVDWEAVRERTAGAVRTAREFLLENILRE